MCQLISETFVELTICVLIKIYRVEILPKVWSGHYEGIWSDFIELTPTTVIQPESSLSPNFIEMPIF
jgi:hypothetical protein